MGFEGLYSYCRRQITLEITLLGYDIALPGNYTANMIENISGKQVRDSGMRLLPVNHVEISQVDVVDGEQLRNSSSE